MDWFVFLILAIGALALMDDVHTKWHQRQMLDPQKKGSNVYV